MMRKALIALMFILIFGSLPILAQTATPTYEPPAYTTIDVSNTGLTSGVVRGGYRDELMSGYQEYCGTGTSGHIGGTQAFVEWTFPTSRLITHVAMYMSGYSSVDARPRVYIDSTLIQTMAYQGPWNGNVLPTTWNFTDTIGTTLRFEWDLDPNTGCVLLNLMDIHYQTGWFSSTPTPTATPIPLTLVNPIRQADLFNGSDMYEYTNSGWNCNFSLCNNQVDPMDIKPLYTGISAQPGVYVFIPEPVRIIEITPVSSNSYFNNLALYNQTIAYQYIEEPCLWTKSMFGDCYIVMPELYTNGEATDMWWQLPNVVSDLAGGSQNTWEMVVMQSLDEFSRTYVYALSNVNVQIGEELTEICSLGTTIPITDPVFSSLASISLGILAAENVGTMGATVFDDGDLIDPGEFYTLEADVTTKPCNTPPQYEDCLFNPVMSEPNEWKSDNANWTTDRVTLSSGGYVEKNVQLDLSTDPQISVYASGIGGTTYGFIKMLPLEGINAFTSVDYPSGFIQRRLSMTDQTGVTLVTIYVSNDGEVPLEIRSICIQSGDVDPPTENSNDIFSPTQCTFRNADISSNAYWSVSDADYKAGEFRLATGGIVAQTLDLTAGDYYLTVFGYLFYDAKYTLDKDSTDSVVVEFNMGDGWEELATITEGDFVAERNFMQRSVMYNLADDYEGLVQIRATMTGFGSEFQFAVLSACLSTSEFDETGTSPFPQRCGTPINNPPGESQAIWTQWLWANQWDFFNCKLMVLLNSMYKLMLQMFETWGWTVRWTQFALKSAYVWLNTDLFPWLNGQFYNIATGRTTVVGSGGCDNFWCFLESLINGVLSPILSIVQTLIDLIFSVLTFFLDILGGLIDLVFRFVGFLIDSLSNVWGLFAAFIGMWNDTDPVDLPYLPTCSVNPQANGMCVALWMLENTVFSGTGSVFIPLIVSWGSIMALLWGAKRLKKAVMEAGNLI